MEFSRNRGGYSQGFNDSSKEYFTAGALEHVVREIIQNSLDAKDERYSDRPVVVKMRMLDLKSKLINSSDLEKHVKQSLKATESQNNQKGIEFYKKSLKLLKKSSIPTLKIIDENTTGLKDDKWEALVYKEGITSKNDKSAGGSYGIGKNAPYVASSLSTICYSTRFLNGHRDEKFIIRSKLVSHEHPDGSEKELQHIGYGTDTEQVVKKFFPPISGNKIHKDFRLKRDGTGIFILGFNQKDWEIAARRSIARNFFAAINDKKLIVHIENTVISHENLHDEFEKKSDKIYYDLYKNSSEKIPIVGRFGKFYLKIATDDEYMKNDVAYINKKGMLITKDRRISKNPFHVKVSPGNYVAVIWAQDPETESKVRRMEPPTHESIEYRKIDEAEQADFKEKLDEINNKIKDKIKTALNIEEGGENTVLNELAEIIPFESSQGGDSTDGDKKPGLGKIKIKKTKIKTGSIKVGDEKEGSGTGGTGVGKGGSSGSTHHTPTKAAATNMTNERIIRHGKTLRILFNSKTDTNKFTIHPVGEEDKNDKQIHIISAKSSEENTQTVLNNDFVTVHSKNGKRVSLDITIDESLQYTGYKIVEYETTEKSK